MSPRNMSSIVIHRLSPFSHLHSLRKKTFFFCSLLPSTAAASLLTEEIVHNSQSLSNSPPSCTFSLPSIPSFSASYFPIFLFFSPKLLPVYSLLPCFLVLSSPPVSPVFPVSSLSTSPSPPSPSLPPGGRLPSENLQGGTNKCCYVIQCYVMPSNALSS